MPIEDKRRMKSSARQQSRSNAYARYLKRPLGFMISLVALIVLSPVFLITAFLVRVKLGSPVLFKQQRIGRYEHVFTLYKFRTLSNDRDGDGNLLPDRLRATPFGNMLRKRSLDELPELVNILKGDMSIVGPRPLVVEYLPYYSEEERHRHSVRPGLTGLAQVRGRSYLSWEDRFKLDNEYIEKCSLALDCRIMWETLIQVFRRKNVADLEEIQTDHKGTYIQHEGRVLRRLDVERSDIACKRK